MNGSQASCLGAWMDAATFHLRDMQEEEEINGVLSQECEALSY